ncbi:MULTISPECIES: UPF0223 family protein [Bacillaceae]|uniref:UPF0223 family protein n=1 Tax=Bacillaceae TaxID=186817 RepID=UPI001E46BCC3|nr:MULTISPECIES: UPF0223 family protein [Bacillaceae]MCE4048445.1 UPF0223 family protein [Bacillus sp. Au-Bac7]MCM3029118.1 UPF0223 family protein [Niallia sp. MER 6]MDL0434995.1 UPF0223 family protein [Niallia sp. SS-2023]UPO88801.1 UPF0223 family protein [Niallia sp. Man26]
MEYQYPIDIDWSTEEIVEVVKFFECIEAAYEKGIEKEALMEQYKLFKKIVPGKAQEKNVCDEFEEVSGYSTYRTIKKAKEAEAGTKIKMP